MCYPFETCALCRKRLLFQYVYLNKGTDGGFYYFCDAPCRTEFILRSNQRIPPQPQVFLNERRRSQLVSGRYAHANYQEF